MMESDIKPKNGFSLLEIIVVVAILGLVAVIAVPSLSSWTSSRKAENDVSKIRALIDYAKIRSQNIGFPIIIEMNNNQLKVMNTNIQNSGYCQAGGSSSSLTMNDPEYPIAIDLETEVRSKHNSSGDSSGSSYTNMGSRICFKSDGTSKGGGFEITRDTDKFRVDIGPTSFYEVTRLNPKTNTWVEWD
jgi:prepilin-type N-terminal cleavage/methylation domain-containing protein